ncbi:hypothetical protein FACS189427_01000 [Planctomycetales bacterium]|nr:hypothetical protein FACS1894214_1270 [Planctomycetales bacterium]GHT34172.1 hypothetical protein FACS189427_01000 [Planctomycetales bacterium]
MKSVKCLLFDCLAAVFVCLLITSVAKSQEHSHLDAVFAEHLAPDDAVLKNNPNIAEAYEVWKSKIEESTTAYCAKLETFLEREKKKGDLDFLKGMETTIEKAKSQHVSPCILFERLPPKVAPLLADMNKAKSKANKTYLSVLDKEIAAVLKQKNLDTAKAIENFVYISFLPQIMQSNFSEAVRYENKIFLFVAQEKVWQDAYDWSRERNGDLASIHSKKEDEFLCKIIFKQGKVNPPLAGGYKISNRWFWTDGTPFDFTNWAKGQPDGTSRGKKVEDRICFYYGADTAWNDMTADSKKPFILQWTLY